MAVAVSGLITIADRAYLRFEVASALTPLNDLATARAQMQSRQQRLSRWSSPVSLGIISLGKRNKKQLLAWDR